MTLSVNTLKDKWHRYFSNQILLLHYPAYDFSHNYFCLPIWDSSSSFMRLDLSFTEGFLLWKLHSFLHIFHFLLSATFSFNRWHLKKKKKREEKKSSFWLHFFPWLPFSFLLILKTKLLEKSLVVPFSNSSTTYTYFSLEILYLLIFLLLKRHRLCFLEQFKFTEKLNREHRAFPYIPFPCTYRIPHSHYHSLCIVYISIYSRCYKL